MSKMFNKGFTPKSTTKKAKQIIRNEVLSVFSKDYGYDKNDNRTRLQRMKDQADSANAGWSKGRYPQPSDYNKAKYLVDGGCYRCYFNDQAEFLGKIYGKKNVEKWDGMKIHNTYSHLIGREYSKMLEEKRKRVNKNGK